MGKNSLDKLIISEKEEAQRIMEKEHPTLDEIKYVLINEAFFMRVAGTNADRDFYLLSDYFDNIAPRTVNGLYKKYISRNPRRLTHNETQSVYNGARRHSKR